MLPREKLQREAVMRRKLQVEGVAAERYAGQQKGPGHRDQGGHDDEPGGQQAATHTGLPPNHMPTGADSIMAKGSSPAMSRTASRQAGAAVGSAMQLQRATRWPASRPSTIARP